MAIIRSKIVFETGQETIETDKIIFQSGYGVSICQKISFIEVSYWDKPAVTIRPKKAFRFIKVRLCVEDATGLVYVSDLMLQGGRMAILWSGHVSEIKFSFEQ